MRERFAAFAKGVCGGLLDLVYPPFCLTCGRPGDSYLCAECIASILLIEYPYCRRCGAPSETGTCLECLNQDFPFVSAHCAGVYEGVLRSAIHMLKYSFHEPIVDSLGRIMTERYPDSLLAGRVDCVVPVPIHRSRMLERGFNQSEELARYICRETGLRMESGVLKQTRRTRHQVNLPQEQRRENVRGAFAAHERHRIRGRRILLVDDVFTTGATLAEAASTLRAAGAKSVHVYTLARSI